MRLGKKRIYIATEDVAENVEVQEGEEEMEKVGFFAKHKKGILIGAGAAALAAIGGLIAAGKRGDDFEDCDDDFDLDDTSDDDGSADDAE